jgi:tetratricopeptide (TPR) repeat protein
MKRHRVAITRTAAAVLVLGLVAFGVNEIQEANARREADLRKAAEQREAERVEADRKLKLEADRRAKAQREADELAAKEQAVKDVQRFRRKAEEATMYCAFQDPGTDFIPYIDLGKAEEAGRAALASLAPYAPDLGKLPLEGERPAVKAELYDLLVLLAQTKGRRAAGPEAVRGMTELLDRAAVLRAPTTSHHLVRAEGWRLLGDKGKAAAEEARARAAKAPPGALDHFLSGERLRTQHARAGQGAGEAKQSKEATERLKNAIKEYRQALGLDPRHYWAHFQIAQCYLAMREVDAAVEELGYCVGLQPEIPWAYSARGQVLGLQAARLPPGPAQQKREALALADLDQAIKLRPGDRQARLNRGFFHLQRNHYQAALADLNAVLDDPPAERMLDAYFYRGQLQEQNGKVDEALKDFTLLAEAKGKAHPVFLRRARIWFARGEPKRGLADVDAFLGQGNAPYPERLAKRAKELYGLIGRVAQKPREEILRLAALDLQNAIAGGVRSAEVYDDLGAVLQHQRKIPQALKAYDEAIKRSPKDAALRVKRAWARLELVAADAVQYQKALEDFGAALAINPDLAEAHSGFGYVQACLGRAGGGTRQAMKAILHGGGDYMLVHNVACIYAKLADLELKRAEDIKAPGPDAFRAEVLKRSREFEDLAIDLIQREIELWRKDRTGRNVYDLIREEEAFERLLTLPRVQKLLKEEV